jgi:PAS domain S-box-containing protein
MGVYSYRSASRLAENSRWVAHTHEVLGGLSALYADVVAVESARRAYVITADPAQAERVRATAQTVRGRVPELRHLIADNPRQQALLGRLEARINARLAQIDATMAARRQEPGNREGQAAATLTGTRATDEIRGTLAEMFDEERGLLGRRGVEAERSLRRAQWVIGIGSISAGLLVGVASLLFHRESVHRERAEAELRRREALYRAVLSQFPNGAVLLFDGDLRYRLAEGRALEASGLSKAGLEGRTIWEALPADTATAIEPAYRAALAGQATSFEVPFADRHYAVQVSPLAGGGEAIGMVVSMDVTEKKQAQDDVLRLNWELGQKVAETVATNQELEAFSYSVSHDLRAPIRHIGGYVEMLNRRSAHVLDETAQRHLQTIARASKHMGQLIDDLLAFSRMSRTELMRASVPLGSVANEVIESLRPELEGRHVEWKVNGLPEVTGDRAMLRIVINNLVSNAVKYTRPRPQAVIEIGSAVAPPGEVVLFVKDNGVGFDMQYADKLFAPFQRLHGEREFPGTGIGLATVQRIVHRHGGRIWAESAVGQGATFLFTIGGEA